MEKQKDLLNFVLDAHGGLARWNELETVTVHVQIGGKTWGFKGHEGVLNDVKYKAELYQQQASYLQIFSPEHKSKFESGRVAIETQEGSVVEELYNPRDSFAGQTAATQWSKLQLIYFASYAAYTYFTAPFIFTLPEFKTTEIDSWNEGGETWRRLEVLFPDYFESHNKRQVFYYDQNGLLKRHDYWADVLGGTPSAHYVFDYKEFNGIKMPTRRRVYSQDGNNGYKPEPLWVSLDITDVEFQ